MAVPNNGKENYAISNILKQKKQHNLYIGLVRHKDGKFYTVEGMKPKYTNWGPGEPNGPRTENCTHIYHWEGKWNDYKCSSNLYFACEMPLQSKIKI